MEAYDETLDVDEFIESGIALLQVSQCDRINLSQTLTIDKRSIILKYGKLSQQDYEKYTFAPKISEASQALARKAI